MYQLCVGKKGFLNSYLKMKLQIDISNTKYWGPKMKMYLYWKNKCGTMRCILVNPSPCPVNISWFGYHVRDRSSRRIQESTLTKILVTDLWESIKSRKINCATNNRGYLWRFQTDFRRIMWISIPDFLTAYVSYDWERLQKYLIEIMFCFLYRMIQKFRSQKKTTGEEKHIPTSNRTSALKSWSSN